MYPTSQSYKDAIKAQTQKYRMTGYIGQNEFTDENILAGSFSITQQCSGDSQLEIGQTYIGELSCTLRGLSIHRYGYKDMTIAPEFSIWADGTWETVPLGIYRIQEATWSVAGVSIKAYDNMSLFDKAWTDDANGRTAYEWAVRACNECGVTLATTASEFAQLPNGTINLKVYSSASSDIETWRDLLHWLSQTLACNCLIDRAGRLVFKAYGIAHTDEMDDAHRFSGAEFAGYVTRYTGLSVVDMATRMTNYYHLDPDDALVYNLGSNPFLQYGNEEELTRIRRAILLKLQEIDYVPFKVSSLQDPAYDLMDILWFTDGLADVEHVSCITKIVYKYRSGLEMTGAGEDPALANGLNKYDKNLDGILDKLNTIQNSEVQYYFDISDGHVIEDGGSGDVVTDIDYSANPSDGIIFHGEYLLDVMTTEEETTEAYVENDGTLIAEYLVDDRVMPDYQSKTILQDGERRLVHLMYFFDQGNSHNGNFKVRFRAEGARMDLHSGEGRAYITAKTRKWIEFYITVTHRPDRTTYLEGELLDYTGLVVEKIYADGTQEVITDKCSFHPREGWGLNPITADYELITVTVTYREADMVGEMITYTTGFEVKELRQGMIPIEIQCVSLIGPLPGGIIDYYDPDAYFVGSLSVLYRDEVGRTNVVDYEDLPGFVEFDPIQGTMVTDDMFFNGFTQTVSYTEDGVTVRKSWFNTWSPISSGPSWLHAYVYIASDPTTTEYAVGDSISYSGIQVMFDPWRDDPSYDPETWGHPVDITDYLIFDPPEGTQITESMVVDLDPIHGDKRVIYEMTSKSGYEGFYFESWYRLSGWLYITEGE